MCCTPRRVGSVVDFGSGRDTRPAVAAPVEDLTGTPLYLAAPELFAGAPASVLTDIYSLGVLLDHLVTGSYPLAGRTLQDIKEAHASDRRIP
jgi:serine/threonine-protein kinase